MEHLILQIRLKLLEERITAVERRQSYEHKHIIGITDDELDRLINDEGYELLHSQFLQSFNRVEHGSPQVKHCVTLRRVKPPAAPPSPRAIAPPPAPPTISPRYPAPPGQPMTPPAPHYNMHATYEDALRHGYPANILMQIAERDARRAFTDAIATRRPAPTRPSFMLSS